MRWYIYIHNHREKMYFIVGRKRQRWLLLLDNHSYVPVTSLHNEFIKYAENAFKLSPAIPF